MELPGILWTPYALLADEPVKIEQIALEAAPVLALREATDFPESHFSVDGGEFGGDF
jgi:hypothetical protein